MQRWFRAEMSGYYRAKGFRSRYIYQAQYPNGEFEIGRTPQKAVLNLRTSYAQSRQMGYWEWPEWDR